jgi:hypothetical protein
MEFITNKFKNLSFSCSGTDLGKSPDSETSSEILESTIRSTLYEIIFKSQEAFSQQQQNQIHHEMLRKVDNLPPIRPFKVTFQEWMYEEMSQETRDYFLSKKAKVNDIISCRKLSEFETNEQQIQAIREHSEKSFNLRQEFNRYAELRYARRSSFEDQPHAREEREHLPTSPELPKRHRRVSFQVNNSHFFNTTPKNALDLLRLQYSDAEDNGNDADNKMEYEETNQPQLSVRDAWQWKAGADEVKQANRVPQSSNLHRRNLNSTLKLKRKKITKSKCCMF